MHNFMLYDSDSQFRNIKYFTIIIQSYLVPSLSYFVEILKCGHVIGHPKDTCCYKNSGKKVYFEIGLREKTMFFRQKLGGKGAVLGKKLREKNSSFSVGTLALLYQSEEDPS